MEVTIHWFIARDGRQHGPVSDLEMRKLVELGHLRQTDLLWRQGFPDWRPAPAVFASAPPSPAPFIPERPRQPAAPGSMPRFEQTAGRGAAPGASSGTAAAHGTPMGQGTGQTMGQAMGQGWPQPQQNGPQADWRGQPQFGPAAGTGQQNANFDASPRRLGEPLESSSPAAERDRPRGRMRRALVATTVLALLGGGGWYAAKHRTAIKEFIAAKTSSGSKQTASATAEITPAAAPAAAAPTPPSPAAAEAVAVAAVPVSAEAVEKIGSALQQTAHWKLVATEFPDWYKSTVEAAARMTAEGKSDAEVAISLTTALAKLRQSYADAALGASNASLKGVAVAFKNTVASMAKQGTPICMSFIMSGETSPTIAPVIADPAKNAEIYAHFLAVFTAVAEGRRTATQHADPADGDYKLLVAELVKAGWTQQELELFADPKGANRAAPDRYCQMMQDFFAAHLSIADPAVQDRLLHRTLKLVVAG